MAFRYRAFNVVAQGASNVGPTRAAQFMALHYYMRDSYPALWRALRVRFEYQQIVPTQASEPHVT
jgi:hypothetical protein